jgi:hypothetical protein
MDADFQIMLGALDPEHFYRGSDNAEFGLALMASQIRDTFFLSKNFSEAEASLILLSKDVSPMERLLILGTPDMEVYDPRDCPEDFIVTAMAGEQIHMLLPVVWESIHESEGFIGGVLTRVVKSSGQLALVQHLISEADWEQFGIYPFTATPTGLLQGTPLVEDNDPSSESLDYPALVKKYLKKISEVST